MARDAMRHRSGDRRDRNGTDLGDRHGRSAGGGRAALPQPRSLRGPRSCSPIASSQARRVGLLPRAVDRWHQDPGRQPATCRSSRPHDGIVFELSSPAGRARLLAEPEPLSDHLPRRCSAAVPLGAETQVLRPRPGNRRDVWPTFELPGARPTADRAGPRILDRGVDPRAARFSPLAGLDQACPSARVSNRPSAAKSLTTSGLSRLGAVRT